jgi:hypothetical protein
VEVLAMLLPIVLAATVATAERTADTKVRDEAVAAARALIVKDLGVCAEDVNLRRATATDWPDARLGCPGKEVAAPVVVPGYRVLLEARGRTYEVHTGGGRAVRCKPERRGPPLPEKRTQQ